MIEEGRESIAMLLKGEFDRLSFGVDRTDLLMSLLSECRSSVVLRGGSGEELGYGVLRHGARHSYLGPVVAESKGSGRVIVTQLLGREHKGGVIWDLPTKNDAAVELAVELGFCRQRPLFRMWRPAPIMADRSDRIWAIVDPALG